MLRRWIILHEKERLLIANLGHTHQVSIMHTVKIRWIKRFLHNLHFYENHTMTKRLSQIIAILLFFVSALVVFHRSSPYYPNMVMDSSESLTISFLLNGQKSLTDCEATIANLASAALAKCPNCRIKQLQCLTELDIEKERQLSSAPLDIPSARMVSGVAIFNSKDPAQALFSCQESERQSAYNTNSASRLKCFPPESPRILESEYNTLDPFHVSIGQASGTLLLLGISAFLFFGTWRLGPGDTLSFKRLTLYKIAHFPRQIKQIIIAATDIISILLSLWLAFALRMEFSALPNDNNLWLFITAPLLAIPVFIRFGLYQSITRYLGLSFIATIFKSVILYIALFALAVFLLDMKLPRSVLVAHGLLTLLLITATRIIARDWANKIKFLSHTSPHERHNVLMYGAGSAGVQLASALEFSRELHPVAFIDDEPTLRFQLINGLKVYGPDSLQELLKLHSISEILLAMPSTQRTRRNEIIRLLEQITVSVRTLPGMDELAHGKVKVDDLREVDIEDLLGRAPVNPDSSLMQKNITGKAILVTGAGGSIGSELCRQILHLQPKCLVLFERNEFALYSVEQELLKLFQKYTSEYRSEIIPMLGSVTEQNRLERVLSRFEIETMFHAAAYKHVPMVEKNPAEGLYNNVFGTWYAAQAALASNVETFVLISTDKAVRPTNTMGSTKRFSEMILQALAVAYPDKTRFSMVRFGNVLGSSGSVIPLFREQIKHGGPITVTDPRIIRYFMTIPEAAQLVIQAGAMGNDGDVFVLDMGEPIKILDLAKRMIHLSGLSIKNEQNPYGDIEIVFTGLRPGEKMYEELLIGENVVKTNHPRIMRANEESLSLKTIQDFIGRFEDIYKRNATYELRAVLMESVKGFSPQCGNEDLLALRGESATL